MTRPLASSPLLAVLLGFIICGVRGAEAAQPNIVVIFIDDLGYADIGPFGAMLQKTPNLDRMASEGLKLTSFYAAPVCSVSRAQLLTGCYGARISVPGVYSPGNSHGLNPEEITIAERLKELGYATACIGKWHLGDQPEFLPTNQGFDRYFGIPYSNDMQREAIGDAGKVVPLLRDDKVAELLTDEEQSRIVERYTDEAILFMEENKDRPFFLYFPHTAVHTPIFPGEAFRGKSNNGRFGDWVEEVDWSVGRVLETLSKLQLDEKTLVVFTSDNGPWLSKGADGGSALPLRGGKGSTWEGGVRVPTLVRWPGKVEAGGICDTVAGTIDLLPTFVALAGGEVSEEPIIDGRDISPLLLGKTTEASREAHYYFSSYNLQAVRQGPWKLAIAPQKESMGKEGIEPDSTENPRIYHLDDEIGERTNLASKHPDIVAKLQVLAENMATEIGGNSPVARRLAGEVPDPQTLYPTEEVQKKEKRKPGGRRIALDGLKSGDSISSVEAPEVVGMPFSVSLTIETEQNDAIILSHGGVAVGYALHLRGGSAVFAVRSGAGENITEIVSPEAVPRGARISASLGSDLTMSLLINDSLVASGKSPALISRQPQEDFCLGHDSQKPVTSYSFSGPFEGQISNLKITTP